MVWCPPRPGLALVLLLLTIGTSLPTGVVAEHGEAHVFRHLEPRDANGTIVARFMFDFPSPTRCTVLFGVWSDQIEDQFDMVLTDDQGHLVIRGWPGENDAKVLGQDLLGPGTGSQHGGHAFSFDVVYEGPVTILVAADDVGFDPSNPFVSPFHFELGCDKEFSGGLVGTGDEVVFVSHHDLEVDEDDAVVQVGAHSAASVDDGRLAFEMAASDVFVASRLDNRGLYPTGTTSPVAHAEGRLEHPGGVLPFVHDGDGEPWWLDGGAAGTYSVTMDMENIGLWGRWFAVALGTRPHTA